MAVRSKRLGTHAGALTTTPVSLFTCPAGRTAIVKSVVIHARNSTTGDVVVALRTGSVAYEAVRQAVTSPSSWRFNDLFWVLEPGDILQAYGGASLPEVRIWASGTLLLGEPS